MPCFGQPVLAHITRSLCAKKSSPHWGGTADIVSGYRSIFCTGSNQETSVAVQWKMTYHVTPPSCFVVNRERLVTKDGIKSNFWPKRRQKRPLPKPTSERCSSHKLISFQASKMPAKANGTVRVRFTSAHERGENWSGQNGSHFADNIFRCIHLNENVIKISLNFVPKASIINIPASVQIMFWRQIGDRPLSEPMLTPFTDAYMRH